MHESAIPCFQAPAAGEVVAGGRKLVGSAQRCEHGALLQHGSILLSGSQTRVLDLLAQPAPAPHAPDGSVTLAELIGGETRVADLIAALCRGFEQTFGTRLAPGNLNQCESDRAAELTDRYRSDQWTWRR